MDYEEEIQQELGEYNLLILYEEITNGKLTRPEIRNIAKKMHSHVYGVYIENRSESDKLIDIFKMMLDKWYKCELYNPEVKSKDR